MIAPSLATEQDRLWKNYRRSRSVENRNALVVVYMPMVKHMADNLMRSLPGAATTTFADLTQVGAMGLMQTVESFDPQRGVKFKTYCSRRVNGAMVDLLREEDPIPRSARKIVRRLEHVTEQLRATHGLRPGDSEIAAQSGLTGEQCRSAASMSVAFGSHAISMEAPTDNVIDGVAPTLADAIAHERPMPDEQAAARDMVKRLDKHLDTRERLILRLYHGMGMSMRETGKAVGISESRVCQLLTEMMTRLRGDKELQQEYGAKMNNANPTRAFRKRAKTLVNSRLDGKITAGEYDTRLAYLRMREANRMKAREAKKNAKARRCKPSAEVTKMLADAGPSVPYEKVRKELGLKEVAAA